MEHSVALLQIQINAANRFIDSDLAIFLPNSVVTGMPWGSISLFAGFLEKENSLETLIVIFEKVSPKGFF